MDTANLLKSCNVCCKYAIIGMKQALTFVENPRLKRTIELCLEKHFVFAEACSFILNGNGKSEKEPSALKLAVSRIKTDLKLTFSQSSRNVASVMVKGCNEGIKEICKSLERFSKAEGESVELAKSIIKTFQEFMEEMIEYY